MYPYTGILLFLFFTSLFFPPISSLYVHDVKYIFPPFSTQITDNYITLQWILAAPPSQWQRLRGESEDKSTFESKKLKNKQTVLSSTMGVYSFRCPQLCPP